MKITSSSEIFMVLFNYCLILTTVIQGKEGA